MNDYHVPLWGVLAGTGWLIAIALMIAGWVYVVDGQHAVGLMLAHTALLIAAIAVSLTSTLIAGEVMTRVEQGRSNGTGI